MRNGRGAMQGAATSPPHGRDRLRIVLVSTQKGWHGGEGQAYLLALGMRELGHDCRILARRGGAFARRAWDAGFVIHTFPSKGWSPISLLAVRRFLRQTRPDVLYCNDSHSLNTAGIPALGLPIPARVSARRVDFPIRSASRYRKLCDRVICVSRAVAQVCRNGGLPDGQLCVVHEGVDPSRVLAGDRLRGRFQLQLRENQLLILCVAKLTPHKGHRFLLEAMPEVIKRYPRACLALAGGGELRESLERQVIQLGLRDHVRFLGYRNDVPDLIQAADLFVLPSQTEGLCTSLIDVMFAQRPIVSTTAGGIPDLVGALGNDEPVAWIVPPCDSRALATAILSAVESPQLRTVLTTRAHERAQRLFTARRMVDETLDVCRTVINGSRHRWPAAA